MNVGQRSLKVTAHTPKLFKMFVDDKHIHMNGSTAATQECCQLAVLCATQAYISMWGAGHQKVGIDRPKYQ